MSSTLRAGVFLGLLVAVWTFVVGFTGWYKDPAMAFMFVPGAIVANIVAIAWGLRLTAREGRRFGGQVLAALTIGVVGAAIIFVGSMLFTTVVFPDYFREVEAMGRQLYAQQGLSEEQIESALALARPLQTPFWQAFIGAVSTLITSLVLGLIIGAFVRRKS